MAGMKKDQNKNGMKDLFFEAEWGMWWTTSWT